MPFWLGGVLSLLLALGAFAAFKAGKGKKPGVARIILGVALLLLAVLGVLYCLAVALLVGGLR